MRILENKILYENNIFLTKELMLKGFHSYSNDLYMSCVCMLLITRRNEAYIGEFKKQMMKDLNVCNLSNMAEESN
jgi:hypothetical protein